MDLFKRLNEKGQGLVEYALILVLVAVVVIAILLMLGPAVGDVFTRVTIFLKNDPGVITNVEVVRTGGGSGNTIKVTVTVSATTDLTITDSQSHQSQTISSCSGTCPVVTIDDVGPAAGTLTITASAGGGVFKSYPAKS